MNRFAQMKTNFINKINNMDEQQYYEFWDIIYEVLEYNESLDEFSDCIFTCPDCEEKYGECNSDISCYQRFLELCKEK